MHGEPPLRFELWLGVLWLSPAGIAVLGFLATRGRRSRSGRFWSVLVTLGIAAYALAVVAIVLYPFHVDLSLARVFDRGNWRPFRGTLGFLTSRNQTQVRLGAKDFVANVMLFAPLGALVGVRMKHWAAVLSAGLLLVGIAFALELFQGLTIAERTLDIDDALACSLGALGALGAARIARAAARVR